VRPAMPSLARPARSGTIIPHYVELRYRVATRLSYGGHPCVSRACPYSSTLRAGTALYVSPTRSSVIVRSLGGGSRLAISSSRASMRSRAVLASKVKLIGWPLGPDTSVLCTIGPNTFESSPSACGFPRATCRPQRGRPGSGYRMSDLVGDFRHIVCSG
jgi:hypothetical protein